MKKTGHITAWHESDYIYRHADVDHRQNYST